jgi:hypothetical protein
MLKFLRKYNKFILVVFGSVLMVAFLVPQAIQQFGQHPDGFVEARMDGVELRSRQMEMAARELIVLRGLGFASSLGITDDRTADAHWLMLVEEAERAGMVGESGDGEDWLPSIIDAMLRQAIMSNFQLFQQMQTDPQFANQLRDQMRQNLLQLAGEARLNEEELYMTLAKARGVQRLIGTFTSAPRLSQPRADVEVKQDGDRVLANLLVLPARVIVEELPEPNEEELQGHFETYREVDPAESEHVGIGYQLPARVKFAVLKVDQDAIKANVQLDPVEVRTFWQRNAERFGEDFESARERVEDELKTRFAQDVQQTALRALRTEMYRATQGMSEVDGIRDLPPDWEQTRPKLEDLAGVIVEQVEASVGDDGPGFTMPRPEVTIYASKFYTPEELSQEASIRQAQIPAGNNRPIPLWQALFNVHELNPESPLRIQVGVPAVSVAASDRAGSRYYFTVLEAREASPAESLDEVRQKAIENFKRLAAYQMLRMRESEFTELAQNESLDAVADLFGPEDPETGADAVGAPTVRNRVSIGQSQLFGQQYAEDEQKLRSEVIEAASAIDPATPIDEYPRDKTLVVVHLPQQTSLALVRIIQNQPVTYERLRGMLQQAVLQNAISQEFIDVGIRDDYPFSFESLAARLNWEYVGRRGEPEIDEEMASEDSEEVG